LLEIQIDRGDGAYTVCRPVGELDAFTVSQFRQALAELASTPRLLIDMSGVPFVDSAGLGALVGAHKKLRAAGGALVLHCEQPRILRLFSITGLTRLFTIEAARAGNAAPATDAVPEVDLPDTAVS